MKTISGWPPDSPEEGEEESHPLDFKEDKEPPKLDSV